MNLSTCLLYRPKITMEGSTSRKHPLFQLHFQLTIIVENDPFNYNLIFSTTIYFFQLLTTKVERYKSKMKL
jgi:hypothetical protein